MIIDFGNKGNGGSTGGGIPEAPQNGKIYGRKNATWTEVTGGGGAGGDKVVEFWRAPVNYDNTELLPLTDEQKAENIATYNELIKDPDWMHKNIIAFKIKGYADACVGPDIQRRYVTIGDWTNMGAPLVFVWVDDIQGKSILDTFDSSTGNFTLLMAGATTSEIVDGMIGDKIAPNGIFFIMPNPYKEGATIDENQKHINANSVYLLNNANLSKYRNVNLGYFDENIGWVYLQAEWKYFQPYNAVQLWFEDNQNIGTDLNCKRGMVQIDGEGNCAIGNIEETITEAPKNGKSYARKDGSWEEVSFNDFKTVTFITPMVRLTDGVISLDALDAASMELNANARKQIYQSVAVRFKNFNKWGGVADLPILSVKDRFNYTLVVVPTTDKTSKYAVSVTINEDGSIVLDPTLPAFKLELDGSTGGGISDAPIDGKQYARQDGTWAEVTGGGTIDTTNLAKLDGENTFTGYNIFGGSVRFDNEVIMMGGGASSSADIASGIACAFKAGNTQSIDAWQRNIHLGTDGNPLRIVSSDEQGTTQYAKIDETGIYEGETLLSEKYASKTYVDEIVGTANNRLNLI